MKPNENGSSAKDAANESQTPEAVAFENALRQVLRVSKEEVMRREAEAKTNRKSKHPPER